MTAASSNFVNFLLAELACAAARTHLRAVEIDSIGVALRGNFIGADDAIEWAHEVGALDLMSSAITLASTT